MKVALILGDSPLIKTCEYELPYILNKYFSLGINRIIRKYTTSRHIFVDEEMAYLSNEYPDIPAITIPKNGNLLNKEKELINTFSNKVDIAYHNLVEFKVINENNELAWCGFTHDYAISYLVSKGYENIVLIGTADFIDGTHYSIDEKPFDRSAILQKNSVQFIESVHNDKAVIYTINPFSLLNVNFISVEELLKGEI